MPFLLSVYESNNDLILTSLYFLILASLNVLSMTGKLWSGRTPENEIQIYTWMDATLKELTGLIKEVNPDARR